MQTDNHNPYSPPTAPVGESHTEEGSVPKAVLSAAALAIVGNVLVRALYKELVAEGGLVENAVEAPPETWVLLLAFFAGRTTLLIVAGYICTRISKRPGYRWASLVALIFFAYSVLISDVSTGIGTFVGGFIWIFASVLIGARLGKARSRENPA